MQNDPAIKTNKGDCINLTATWRDSEGAPVDLTDLSVEIQDAQPASLFDAVVTVTDAPAGKFTMFVDSPIANTLNSGQRNWFRLAAKSADGCTDATPRIWIDVQ